MATLNKEQVEQRENDFYDENCSLLESLQQQNSENKSTKDKTNISPNSVKKCDGIKIFLKEIISSPKKNSQFNCNSDLEILNSKPIPYLEDEDESNPKTHKIKGGIILNPEQTKNDSFYENYFENHEKSDQEFFDEHFLLGNKRAKTDHDKSSP